MPHYNSFDSFQTKKSKEKKNKAKNKSLEKINIDENFIIDSKQDYAIVMEVKYNNAYVLYNGEVIVAKLRKDLNAICNKILFPGDKVILENKNNNYIIKNLIKRKSLLSRIKVDSTRQGSASVKNIAANVDLAVIVVSAKEPPLHAKFIDRYLLILQSSNIDSVICLNKCEQKSKEEEEILEIYRKIGIKIIETSTYNNVGIEELQKTLKGKQAIFVGNSGVGKSSLTNALMNLDSIKTGEVSQKSKRGCHTTTSSKYYVWDEKSSIIDTPGIRSLDVSSFDIDEIKEYFYEFREYNGKCKYKDCLHFMEPIDTCAIKQAVEAGRINKNRYESYIRIVNELSK